MIVYNKLNGQAHVCQKHPFKDEYLIPSDMVETAPPGYDATKQKAEYLFDKWQISNLEVEAEITSTETSSDMPTAMDLLRQMRDEKLAASDFRMVTDYAGTDQDAWKAYRVKLRNIPSDIDAGKLPKPTISETDPYAIVWNSWPKEP